MNAQRLLLIAALAAFGAACTGDRETGESGPDDAQDSMPPPTVSATKTTGDEPPDEDASGLGVTALHMHHHARQLARLNAALAAGDLDAASTPAYWISRHDTVVGIGDELMHYLDDMRAAALETEQATDLAVARSAAGRIAEACASCHDAAGIDADIKANAAAR